MRRRADADRGAEPPQHGQGRDCPPRRSAAEKTSAAQKAEIEEGAGPTRRTLAVQ